MARKRKQQPDPSDAPKPAAAAPKVATQLGALLAQAGVQAAGRGGVKAGKQASKPASKQTSKQTPPTHGASNSAARGPNTLLPPGPEPAIRVSERPKPAEPARSGNELRLLNDAYAGSRPLGEKSKRRPVSPLAEHANEPTGEHGKLRAEDRVRAEDRAAERAARARLDALVSGALRWDISRDDGYVHGLRAGASDKLLARVTGKGFAPEARLDLHGKRSADVVRIVSEHVRQSHRNGARNLLIICGKGLHSEGGVGVLAEHVVEALTQSGAAPLVAGFATPHENHGGRGAIAVILQS